MDQLEMSTGKGDMLAERKQEVLGELAHILQGLIPMDRA